MAKASRRETGRAAGAVAAMLAFGLLSAPHAAAGAFCQRDMTVGPEFPAGLAGTYDLIGKDPATATPYAGRLTVSYRDHGYALTRTVGPDTIHGDAWIERCGPDRIVVLMVRYYSRPAPLEMACALGSDGDNYYRPSCRGGYRGRRSPHQGLEAWFQRQ